MKKVDIIVPVLNEAKNVSELVRRISVQMKKIKVSYEIIFVDDHSTDKTVYYLNQLKKLYPVKVFTKKGTPGKAYSIIEAVTLYSKSDYVVMIDADLQYPPEIIGDMIKKAEECFGVVIAKRSKVETSLGRKILSRGFSFVFARVLHGLNYDVQSGLKLFKREILLHTDQKKITPWTLDMSLLMTAKELGYKIGEVDITFAKRIEGESKVNVFKTTKEIGLNSLKLKFNKKKVFVLKPEKGMVGAGFIHKQKRLITHTTLDQKYTALKTFTLWQKIIIFSLILALIGGFLWNPLYAAITVVGILSSIYFIDVVFNLFLILKSLHHPPEITYTTEELDQIKDKDLPVYSILCPLYREAHVIPQFLDAIAKLDYPKNKLDVLLLLEEDDEYSVNAVSKMKLPKYVRVVVVPDAQPKTKPKACNYGLNFVKGEYVVIFDAEDDPEPYQLKKAYLAFQNSPKEVVCLQAKLNYYNPHQNLLTRFFTAEYSLWFDVVLTGLQSINTTIPLGGTSNHFRTKVLIDLEGWDPFNVTEDCDLGVRLFKRGLKTAIIDSITLEEANSNPKNWLRQRSRWIKGYMQTYFVHMRDPFSFVKNQGVHSLIFQLIIGARISFMLINPFLWLMTLFYFVFHSYVGTAIEALYPTIIFYMAVTSLVFGNFMYMYNYMIGLAKREHWSVVKYVFLVPVYWLMASVAAFIAFYQLLVKPHYWEKTVHGLHLAKQKDIEKLVNVAANKAEIKPRVQPRFIRYIFEKKLLVGSLLILFANLTANASNLVFSAYLGKVLPLSEFGTLSLFTSLLFIATIPLDALSATVTQKVAFLFGKYSKQQAKSYLKFVSNGFFIPGLLGCLMWVASIPFLTNFFHIGSTIPLLIFTPVWTIGISAAIYSGYLKGVLSFGKIALILTTEALSKLLFAVLLINLKLSFLVYLSIPMSMLVGLMLLVFFSKRGEEVSLSKAEAKFNKSFYVSALLAGVSTITFLGLDMSLVKHYLSPDQAGLYGLLTLPGRMVFFLGTILGILMLPLVARNEGGNQSSNKTFKILFSLTVLFTTIASISLFIFGNLFMERFFGERIQTILPLLPIFIVTMALFTVAQPIISYFQAKQNHTFVLVGFLVSLTQILLISIFHKDLTQVVQVMFVVSLINLLLIVVLFSLRNKLWVVQAAVRDLYDLIKTPIKITPLPARSVKAGKLRILIFNWRDIKHKWAGGAESYCHELAKKWTDEGHFVTIFSGNDRQNPRYEVIDGIQIVRRGGFYLVYFWAFLYYVIKFRGKYDVVIDSENGMPFFTPLYVGVPKFLLIHHVHQEVFRKYLTFPFDRVAMFIEATLMPLIYRNQKIITVSDSSKKDILKIGLSEENLIDVVNPGVELKNYKKGTKTKYPSLLYIGRLKSYKNIDVAIEAFAKVSKDFSKAHFYIAGEGEYKHILENLVIEFKLEGKVTFLGRVTEKKKAKLLSESWLVVQPSLIEGWGITVIEANASGTAVVAANTNGLKDSVVDGKTGLLVEPNNAGEFALAISKLFKSATLRNKLSKQSLIWSKNFSWEKSSKKFLAIINENLANRKLVIEEELMEGALR